MKKSTTAKGRKYEMALLIKPILPADVTQKVSEPLIAYVKELGGVMKQKATEDGVQPSKKHLAYEIDGIEEGYHMFFALELAADKMPELENKLKFTGDVIRYLIIREEEL